MCRRWTAGPSIPARSGTGALGAGKLSDAHRVGAGFPALYADLHVGYAGAGRLVVQHRAFAFTTVGVALSLHARGFCSRLRLGQGAAGVGALAPLYVDLVEPVRRLYVHGEPVCVRAGVDPSLDWFFIG